MKYLLASFIFHISPLRYHILLCEIRLWTLLENITVMTASYYSSHSSNGEF